MSTDDMPDDHMAVTEVGAPAGATTLNLGSFELESGQIIKDVVICYTTYGELNEVRPTPREGFFFLPPPSSFS